MGRCHWGLSEVMLRLDWGGVLGGLGHTSSHLSHERDFHMVLALTICLRHLQISTLRCVFTDEESMAPRGEVTAGCHLKWAESAVPPWGFPGPGPPVPPRENVHSQRSPLGLTSQALMGDIGHLVSAWPSTCG